MEAGRARGMNFPAEKGLPFGTSFPDLSVYRFPDREKYLIRYLRRRAEHNRMPLGKEPVDRLGKP